jgi:hypothetical protein
MHKDKRHPPWTPTHQGSKRDKDRVCQFQERRQNDHQHITHNSSLFEPSTIRAMGRLFKTSRPRHPLFSFDLTLSKDSQAPQEGTDCGYAH